MLKFQAVAEKMAKNFRGLLILPHPVYCKYVPQVPNCSSSCTENYSYIWINNFQRASHIWWSSYRQCALYKFTYLL